MTSGDCQEPYRFLSVGAGPSTEILLCIHKLGTAGRQQKRLLLFALDSVMRTIEDYSVINSS